MPLQLSLQMVGVWLSYKALVKALDLKAALLMEQEPREEHHVDSRFECCQ